jgi:hypothetical protein
MIAADLVQIICLSDQHFQPTSFQASSYTFMLLTTCVSSQTDRSDMAPHVSSAGLRLGGASDNTASPHTQGEATHFNTPAMVKVPPHSGGTFQFPRTTFSFKPVVAGRPFIADRLRATSFVTFSTSLQLLGLGITALVTFRQSTFV